MVIFYKKWKYDNEIQLKKNKMDLNIRKMTNHPPSPDSKYGNRDRMHVILNGEPLEEVDCFKYLASQVAADGGCERDVVHNE